MHVITYQFRTMSAAKTIKLPANKPRTVFALLKRLREKQAQNSATFTHTFID